MTLPVPVDKTWVELKRLIMRKIFVIAMACFMGTTASAQGTVTATVTKDIDKMVSFTNINYDFGRIPSRKPVEYNVTIRNIGTDTLVLKEVKAGCGCTTPKYRSNEKIAPGKSTFITLGFNGDATGQFERTVDIYFNDDMMFKQAKFHGFAVADSVGVNRR